MVNSRDLQILHLIEKVYTARYQLRGCGMRGEIDLFHIRSTFRVHVVVCLLVLDEQGNASENSKQVSTLDFYE